MGIAFLFSQPPAEKHLWWVLLALSAPWVVEDSLFRCKSISRDVSLFMVLLPSTAISGFISEELTTLVLQSILEKDLHLPENCPTTLFTCENADPMP